MVCTFRMLNYIHSILLFSCTIFIIFFLVILIKIEPPFIIYQLTILLFLFLLLKLTSGPVVGVVVVAAIALVLSCELSVFEWKYRFLRNNDDKYDDSVLPVVFVVVVVAVIANDDATAAADTNVVLLYQIVLKYYIL